MLAIFTTIILINYFGYAVTGAYFAATLGAIGIGSLFLNKNRKEKKNKKENILMIECDKFPATRKLMMELENYKKNERKNRSLLRKIK